jgi:DNA-binding NarL/FixJ family response regulator
MPLPHALRVLIGDDHRIVREGIKQVLRDPSNGTPEIHVMAEAQTGPEVVEAVAARGGNAGLDVVLLDIALPERDGLDVLQALRRDWPALPVLMLSTYPENQYAVRCIRLGAAGYLNKSADSPQIIAAIRKAAAGGLFITPAVAEQLATAVGAGHGRPEEAPHERLSHREYQVFRLLATGRSVGEIATQLALSSNTVSTYRARILEKTGTRNDVELALYAVRADLLKE